MKRITLIIILLIYFNIIQAEGTKMTDIPGKAISLEQLKDMFGHMKKETKWDLSKEMLWGYFFTHKEPKLLESTSILLQQKGFNVVNIYLSDNEEPQEIDMYSLHVEKIEIHSPETLDKRNNELYIFANKHGIDKYDGMDVGPVKNENQKTKFK